MAQLVWRGLRQASSRDGERIDQAQVSRLEANTNRRKISFFGHFGTLNTGNESTLLTILMRLRSRSPEWEFCCICTNPELVAARDGIQAVPISTRVVRVWDNQAPLGERLRVAVVGIGAELGQYVRAFRTLRGTDMLIVPGTGLLTDAYGLSGWGPYNMFKWTLMARLQGCSVSFVSVGAGPIDGALGRILVKATLRLANYRSYRDESSKDYLEGIGFRTNHDRIYPDLVFGLPETLMPADRAERGGRRAVGLGLMFYPGRYSAGNPSRDAYVAYLRSLVEFVDWLLGREYDVRLLLGDGDTIAIEEFESLLRARLGAYDEERIIYQPASSVHELLEQLTAVDIAVATRFHNVLLALVLNKPVVAISFHHKCTSLMADLNLSEYCHDINHMNIERLIEQFEDLERNSDTVVRTIGEGVEECRRALDEQYDLLLKRL